MPTPSTLALHGGAPIGKDLKPPVWPPRTPETARRLADLYLGGGWTFNLSGEADALCREFAEFCGVKHAIFMANGTVTLMSALAGHGVKPGDEIIVPACTWPIAMTAAAAYVGAKIVFVDVEPTTLCLDPEKFEDAITERTKAVIPVHFMGSMADMDRIMEVARRHDIFVLEDCAQTHGSQWGGSQAGSIGHVGSFSFHQTKIITGGEGGICTTNDPVLAERIHRIAHVGYAPDEKIGQYGTRPEQGLICHNFRCTEFQALVIRDQLKAFPALVAKYGRNAKYLSDRISEIDGVRIQSPGRRTAPQTYYQLALIFDGEPLHDIPIGIIAEAFRAEGLPADISRGPVYRHVLFNLPDPDYRIHGGRCAVAEDIATDRLLTLPHQWLGADDATIETIADIIQKIATNARTLKANGTVPNCGIQGK